MLFEVEIMKLEDVPPPRHAVLLESYDIEANSSEEARVLGYERFIRDSSHGSWDLVYSRPKR